MSRAIFSSSMGCSWPKIWGFWGIPGRGRGEKDNDPLALLSGGEETRDGLEVGLHDPGGLFQPQ